jgi:REP element-mobilizing transposase RayT
MVKCLYLSDFIVMPNAFPHKNIRLAEAAYTGSKAFFITLCSADRRAVFTDSVVAPRLLHLLSEEAERHAFAIRAYCLMPDHLHFLAQGTQADCNLLRFVKAFRIRSSRGYAGETGAFFGRRSISTIFCDRDRL